MTIEQFIARHRGALVFAIHSLRDNATHTGATLDFTHAVLTDFDNLQDGLTAAPVTPEERAFWFGLYQLETLSETPSPVHRDPYDEIMLGDLEGLAPILASGDPLPERFFATRPGEAFDVRDDRAEVAA